MMPLQTTIENHKQEIADEPNRWDFLVGPSDPEPGHNFSIADKVIRIDEVHPSEDNDSHFLFLIWVDPTDDAEVREQVQKNIEIAAGTYGCNEWTTELLPNTGAGLLIVSTWL